MAESIALVVQPTLSQSHDPFVLIVELINANIDYLKRIMNATCDGLWADKLDGPGLDTHVYVLVKDDGAVDVHRGFLAYWTATPGPNTWLAFRKAIDGARELASGAGIPFAESAPVFRELIELHDRNQRFSVFPPKAKAALFPNAVKTGPYPLSAVWMRELEPCSRLFPRLQEIAAHVSCARSRVEIHDLPQTPPTTKGGAIPLTPKTPSGRVPMAYQQFLQASGSLAENGVFDPTLGQCYDWCVEAGMEVPALANTWETAIRRH